MKHVAWTGIVAIVGMTVVGQAWTQPGNTTPGDLTVRADVGQMVDQLTTRVERVELRLARRNSGAVLLLFGAFCALWAQYTKRNPWLWFVFGTIFNVLALPMVLMKNADAMKGIAPSRRRTMNQGAVFLGLLAALVVVLWLASRL